LRESIPVYSATEERRPGKRRIETSSVLHSEREMSHTYSDLGSGARHLDCHLRP
jgi:hypothetical protein